MFGGDQPKVEVCRYGQTVPGSFQPREKNKTTNAGGAKESWPTHSSPLRQRRGESRLRCGCGKRLIAWAASADHFAWHSIESATWHCSKSRGKSAIDTNSWKFYNMATTSEEMAIQIGGQHKQTWMKHSPKRQHTGTREGASARQTKLLNKWEYDIRGGREVDSQHPRDRWKWGARSPSHPRSSTEAIGPERFRAPHPHAYIETASCTDTNPGIWLVVTHPYVMSGREIREFIQVAGNERGQ
ncbi:hypothetical protein BJ322DRAFT_1016987 [Thelephora terrestris]|uniref:Uncharacterized protein n=1 Tax=Thelephora terrestris TaxID=56493 RepID=A0A9P6LED3_9AGAM|nr:hypothetical protein BJ322DRAFT_1016987 [Thelephora terrestris]